MKTRTKIKAALLFVIPFWAFFKLFSIRGTVGNIEKFDMNDRDAIENFILNNKSEIKRIMHSEQDNCAICEDKERIDIQGQEFSHYISVFNNTKCHLVCELQAKPNQE